MSRVLAGGVACSGQSQPKAPGSRFSDTHGTKRHLGSWAVGAPFPCEEHGGIGLGDVIGPADSERASGAVDPARRTFDLAEVPNRSLIQHHVAGAVAPLRAIFFVAKRGREPKHTQNGVHLRAVLD